MANLIVSIKVLLTTHVLNCMAAHSFILLSNQPHLLTQRYEAMLADIAANDSTFVYESFICSSRQSQLCHQMNFDNKYKPATLYVLFAGETSPDQRELRYKYDGR
jgi:hypothetical protein